MHAPYEFHPILGRLLLLKARAREEHNNSRLSHVFVATPFLILFDLHHISPGHLAILPDRLFALAAKRF
jgi:hypothetical protein